MNLAQLDHAEDWRRFWWVAPPLMIALVLFSGVRVFEQMTSDRLLILRDHASQQFPAASVRAITVDDEVGDIVVEALPASASGEIRIDVTRQGSGRTMDEAFNDLASLLLRTQQTGDTIRINCWRELHFGPGTESKWIVRISAPAGTQLVLRSHKGDVSIKGITADINATADAGDVSVRLPADQPFVLLDGSGKLSSQFKLAPPVDQVSNEFAISGANPRQQLALKAPLGEVTIKHD